MGPNLRKLVSIGGPDLAAAPSQFHAPGPFLPLAPELRRVLQERNGFVAFESALLFRPSGPVDDGTVVSVEEWNTPSTWTSCYKDLAEGCYFFAQDVFGGQFALSSRGVLLFDPETGETDVVATTLEEWAGEVLGDYEVLTGSPLAHEWQQIHGGLPSRHVLAPKKPFVLGGDFVLSNLYLIEEVDSLRARAAIALQLRDLPDGSSVSLEVVG